MAVQQTSENKTAFEQARQTAQQPEVQQTQTANQIQNGGAFSWLGFGQNSVLSVGRNPLSKTISTMEETFKEFSVDVRAPMDIGSVVIDNANNPELQYSVFVMTVTATQLPEKPVAYHAYLIESSGNTLQSEVRNYNGTQVELLRLPSDANDGILRKIISQAVQQRFPNQPILETSSEVVPRNFDIEDKQRMWHAFTNGILACRQMIDKHYNPIDLELTRAKQDTTLTVHVERNSNEVQDTNGLPCRADVLLSTIARSKQQQQSNSLNAQSQALLSRSVGYVDLIWAKQASQQQSSWLGVNNQQQQFEPLYQPVFVTTNGMPEDLQSLPAQLMLLAINALLIEERRWTFALLPRKGTGKKKEIDIHDIGAVGYDANFENNKDGVGSRIVGTDKDDFTLGKLNQLLSLVSKPQLLLALDVPECGSTTWQHAVFSAASDGNTAAQQEIIDAANYLTNGHFGKIWNPAQNGGRICYNYGGRIHMGYYMDQERKQHDIRDIDYLAILNMFGDRDMNMVRQWSDSFNNEAVPLEVRLQWRKAIYDQLSAVYTGWGRRNVFDGHFIQALSQACAAAGLALKPEVPYNDATTDVRTAAGFLATAVTMNVQNSGMFTITGNTYNGGNYYNGAYTGYTSGGNTVGLNI